MALWQGNGPNNVGGEEASSSRRIGYAYRQESADSYAITEMEHEVFSFLWTLRNYSTVSQLEEVKSPVFSGGAESKHLWQIKLDHKMGMYGVKFLGIHLMLLRFGDGNDSPSRDIRVRFQFSLLDSKGRSRVQTELLHASQRLVDDDSLKIHLRVWIEKGVRHQPQLLSDDARASADESRSYQGMKLLSFQMGNIFNEKVLTDIKIRTGTATIEAHKVVLAGRSPVFAAMFALGPHGDPLREIIIEGFDNVIVRDMLQYIYTGEAQLLGERANDLLKIAEKYKLTELKERCEFMLANNITIDNTVDILLLAQEQKANFLKSRAMEFITRNRELLKENPAFKNALAANPNLSMELYLF